MSDIELRAMLEVVLAGGFCGALGFWVVSERLGYAAESLSHGLLPGLVLAGPRGRAAAPRRRRRGARGRRADRPGGARRARRPGRRHRRRGHRAGRLGSLLALVPDAPQRLEELLFGDPLGVTDADIAAAAILLVAGGAALAGLRRPLAAASFDPSGAAALGLRPGAVRLALLGLMAAAIAIAVQGLGALLVLAVLVAPPVAVRRHVRSPGAAMLAGAAVAAAAGVAGIQLSAVAGTAAGASVALVLCGAAAAGAVLPARPA